MPRGGARKGAGRKIQGTEKADIRVMFRLTKEMYNLINTYAQKENLSVGQYVRKIAISNIMDNN
ncbi:hypothetical protein SZ47_12415 [Brachyspira hyodysenteriae]|uniref:Uncharacterized protein n=1 Tax=Brachyspira hyodysenteriae ATCC 27164 TaxID=1266923 RepID=A0A3B6VU85_BRAHO|nr:hypothetical protein [Brachyspira hyodysenteriae]ANN64611.1 hypothetical protein BHYOB78_12290 [Brachyspira hyodysenteriae ATCC 27164]KLI22778.1 hypothetical protein SZ47_12415 [Brachyspira hyodysenteriae]MCZ9924227.1 hypothetical protein [Brachyspira hyodysenteriae]